MRIEMTEEIFVVRKSNVAYTAVDIVLNLVRFANTKFFIMNQHLVVTQLHNPSKLLFALLTLDGFSVF